MIRLRNSKEDHPVIEETGKTPYTATVGYAFSLDQTEDTVKFGFNHFIVGVGRGNFATGLLPDGFEVGTFGFVGFTINAIDLWLSK